MWRKHKHIRYWWILPPNPNGVFDGDEGTTVSANLKYNLVMCLAR